MLVRPVPQHVRLDTPKLPPLDLDELTRQDCEVNAPLTGNLLDGFDLLSALDTSAPLLDFNTLLV